MGLEENERIGFTEEDAKRIGFEKGEEQEGYTTFSFDNGRIVYQCRREEGVYFIEGNRDKSIGEIK